MKSEVWHYFTKEGKAEAKCIKCQKVLKCGGGSTSSLKNHIKDIHKLDDANESTAAGDPLTPPQKKQKLVHEFTTKKSMEEEVAKLACTDGISFEK